MILTQEHIDLELTTGYGDYEVWHNILGEISDIWLHNECLINGRIAVTPEQLTKEFYSELQHEIKETIKLEIKAIKGLL